MCGKAAGNIGNEKRFKKDSYVNDEMQAKEDGMTKQFRWKGYFDILMNGNNQHERVLRNVETCRRGAWKYPYEGGNKNYDEMKNEKGAHSINAYITC